MKFVTGSEGKKLKFEEIALDFGIDCANGLWLDCPIRWNSTCNRALPYLAAFASMRWMEKSIMLFLIFPQMNSGLGLRRFVIFFSHLMR